MHEYTVDIESEDRTMYGIYHDARALPASPTILVWNVGISNRVGPQRHFVDLARKLQKQGFNVLRFDLTGLGNSPQNTKMLAGEDQEVADIRAAMDYLETTKGCQNFILMGHCSSAAGAHPTAVADHRVKGVILIDGYGYRTRRYYLKKFRDKVLSFKHWRRFLVNRVKELKGKTDQNAEFYREFPPRKKVEKELLGLMARNVKMLFIYTSDVYAYYNYPDQFFHMFPVLRPGDNLQIEYISDTDHLFTPLTKKYEYFKKITTWLAHT